MFLSGFLFKNFGQTKTRDEFLPVFIQLLFSFDQRTRKLLYGFVVLVCSVLKKI